MTATLSGLIDSGLDHTTLVFGASGRPVAAGRLAEAGGRLVGSCADAPALGALLTNDRPTVELLLGAIVKGVRLVSLPLPGRAADLEAYANVVGGMCARYGIEVVVARDDIAMLLEGIGVPAKAHSLLGNEPLTAPAPGGFELVQFSSGSTGRPKGIRLDDEVLGVNVMAILGNVCPRPGDVTVSWLPLSHDMGLVGMLLGSVARGGPRWMGGGAIVLMQPEDFLRSPGSWMLAMDRWRGTLTAAPDFGFRMAADRPPAASLDLGHVRCAIVGGEIVRAATLEAFTGRYEAYGFTDEALCPAYGMAELGLAASITPPDRRWRHDELDLWALAGHLRRPRAEGRPTAGLASSGPPLEGYRLDVVAGAEEMGPIRVKAPASGRDAEQGEPLTDAEGWVETGDVGYLDEEGWIFVCGRYDDHLVVRGRNLYAPAIEAAVAQVAGIRRGRVTAVGLPTGDWVVVAESAVGALGDDERRRLIRDVRRAAVHVATAQPSDVVLQAPGRLPMTSSGKLQRNEVRSRWMTGSLTP